MKRRALLLALGGGSAVGTGAVTELSAERGITIAASSDSSAIVQLVPIDDDDTLDELVTTDDGEVKLTVSDLSGTAGEGVNTNAVTALDNLIQVKNLSANQVDLRFTPFGTGDITAEFYTGSAGAPDLREDVTIHTGDNNALPLAVGESRNLGVLIDTSDVESATSGTDSVTITAGVNAG